MTLSTNASKAGWNAYGDLTPEAIFYRASPRQTQPVRVKAGQVVKAHTFMQSDAQGLLVVHQGFAESAHVAFTALTSGQTLIMAGLTFTAGGSGTTVEELVEHFDGILDGESGLTGPNGTFTGTLTGYNIEAHDAGSVMYNSSTSETNITDVANTGTGTVTITVFAAATELAKIAGVLAFDVDATAGDTPGSVYSTASFWSTALNWANGPGETLTTAEGTEIALTPYNTGCSGDGLNAALLQQKFVEGSGFKQLGFQHAGEIY